MMCNFNEAEGRQNMVDDAVQRAVEAERQRLVHLLQRQLPRSILRRNLINEINFGE